MMLNQVAVEDRAAALSKIVEVGRAASHKLNQLLRNQLLLGAK